MRLDSATLPHLGSKTSGKIDSSIPPIQSHPLTHSLHLSYIYTDFRPWTPRVYKRTKQNKVNAITRYRSTDLVGNPWKTGTSFQKEASLQPSVVNSRISLEPAGRQGNNKDKIHTTTPSALQHPTKTTKKYQQKLPKTTTNHQIIWHLPTFSPVLPMIRAHSWRQDLGQRITIHEKSNTYLL